MKIVYIFSIITVIELFLNGYAIVGPGLLVGYGVYKLILKSMEE